MHDKFDLVSRGGTLLPGGCEEPAEAVPSKRVGRQHGYNLAQGAYWKRFKELCTDRQELIFSASDCRIVHVANCCDQHVVKACHLSIVVAVSYDMIRYGQICSMDADHDQIQ